MKNQDSFKPSTLSSSASSSNRFGRFRFPFKQKPSNPIPIISTNTNSTPASAASSGSYGFFNLRKLGSKPPTPVLSQHRKAVSFSSGNMDWKKKVSADHTDVAYREAVSRLRTILSPRPNTPSAAGVLGSPIQRKSNLDANATQNFFDSPPSRKGRFTSGLRSIFAKDGPTYSVENVNPTQLTRSLTLNNAHGYVSPYMQPPIRKPAPTTLSAAGEDDLFGFIEKQGEYIVQLEKETKYCRDELSTMLEKVRDVISENEALHEKQKKDILTSMIQQLDEKTDVYGRTESKQTKKGISGKSDQVIRDSRIAELEAQLSQARRALKLSQEDNMDLRKGKGDLLGGQSQPNVTGSNFVSCELHKSEIEKLSRDKEDLLETLTKFKQTVAELRDRESEASKKVKTSLEIVDQMRDEKAQSDLETRRLKEELDRHQQRVREMIQDHSKKLHEEKIQVEKKYRQEIDHLNNEMNQEMDSLTKAKLDLERQKRVEADLRREIQHKMSTIDDLRQEMQIKISHLQAELSHTLMQKSTAEQDLINSRLQSEKIERDGKQDASRLQAEINGLRKRLEQTDLDFNKSQEVIVRLNENISQLQREASLARIRLEGHLNANSDIHDGDVNSMIQTMEDHSRDMTDLEQLIQVQNSLLDKLRNECKMLTDKLEETSRQYKKERTMAEAEKERLLQMNKAAQEKCVDLEHKVQFYSSSHAQMTDRLHKLEDDDKSRSDRIFQLLSKQSGLLKENQSLQNEVSYMKSKLGDFSSSQNNRVV